MRKADGLEQVPRRAVLDREVVKVGGRGGKVDFSLDDQAAINEVEEGLRHRLGEWNGWFKGVAVTVDVGQRVLNCEELARLRRVFEEEFQLKVAGFWCKSNTLEKALSEGAGVPIGLVPQHRLSLSAGDALRLQGEPLLIKTTCRSGTNIYHEGEVVVRGDVNPGAQVAATGDIIVLGALRGIAHAGAEDGDDSRAVIVALSLTPLQLRIGQQVGIGSGTKRDHNNTGHPEIAYVSGRSIVIEPFTGGGQGTRERKIR